ncbi:MAG: polymerase ECF-subfamily sigma factor [Thermoleophilia bacterium]|nr:polymerase ECF-subfamily sigma factor [Thermoleophilia bacterium]
MHDLVDAHACVLQRVATTQVGPDLADDVVAESFATAWRDRARYRPELGSERSWLVGIVLNRCRDMGRARRRWERRQRDEAERTTAGSTPDFSGGADERLDAASLRTAVMGAVRALDELPRTVLLLVALGELTPAEVAAALDLPPGTVRSHLSRARRSVAQTLQAGSEELT